MKQESLGFSPATLLFGHDVRGPLKVLKESFLSGCMAKTNVVEFVKTCKDRWQWAALLANEALCVSQPNMKRRFDQKAVGRQFQPVVLLRAPNPALMAHLSGPYVIVKKVSDTNYFSQHPRTQEEDSPMPC